MKVVDIYVNLTGRHYVNCSGYLHTYEEVRGTLLFIQYSENLHLVTHSVMVKVDKNHQKFGYFSFLFVISLL